LNPYLEQVGRPKWVNCRAVARYPTVFYMGCTHPSLLGVHNMQRKTKINVRLPVKMVGELERFSRDGKRSEFIADAIRSKLDEQDAFDIDDYDTRTLAVILQNRLLELPNCEMSEILGLVLRKWIK